MEWWVMMWRGVVWRRVGSNRDFPELYRADEQAKVWSQ